jgi:Transcriptional regulator, AbiEi antitoxin/Protein of unknown function (DUF559)
MGSSNDQTFSQRAWRLAERQHGVVARRQLLALGLSAQSVQHRLARGRLHRVERGIYAVGRPELTRHGRWMVAVLSCGPRAALSHMSAAALWGFSGRAGRHTEISVPFASPRRRPAIRVYRRPNLRPEDVDVRDDIPVVVPVLTFIDIARSLDDAKLERAINEADRIGLVDPETLGARLEDYPSRPGVGRMRAVLGRRVFLLTDSELERRFLPLAAAAGLPVPRTQEHVNGFRVDFYWPDLQLVVETDGLRYHRTPAQQTRDRVRDQAHLSAGVVPLRFTHWQVRYEPEHVRTTLSSVAERLGMGSATGAARRHLD